MFFDIEADLGGDVMFQMKLFKYLLNENVFVFFKEPVTIQMIIGALFIIGSGIGLIITKYKKQINFWE